MTVATTHTSRLPDFQQAKKPTSEDRSLQIVAKRSGRGKSEPKLTRVAFKVSRLMEFCSERELQNQTGHSFYDWPLVVGKEVVDNALDACEEAEVAPDITVIVDPGTIIIQDNAGGIDTNTIESILDYTIRVSSREAYVSPTRGAQGMAMLRGRLVIGLLRIDGVGWDVVYDARGHFEEPHTNRSIGCGTIEVRNYLHAMKKPGILPAEFSDANIDIIGPDGNFSSVLFCEKEGFNPLFKAVNLANRFDLMIISTKGVSVTAARKLIDEICGGYGVPLFILHDFDVAGFQILGTLQRDTRRYQFSNAFEVIDLGLRLADIAGLEREPAAATRTSADILRAQLAENGATNAEIDILLNDRVELNAMTSDALIEMIERKLKDYGLEKVIPDNDLLAETYRAFHSSHQLREKFKEIEDEFEEEDNEIQVPENLKEQVRAVLAEHGDLRWDDAIQIVLDETQLDHVRAEKQKAKRQSGDFTDTDEDEEENYEEDDE
jgi:hypothetical protein